MKLDFWKGYALIVTGALAFTVGNAIVPADAGPAPHLHSALEKLQGALAQLNKAKGSRAGHRVKAIEATTLAIEETKAALAAPEDPPTPAPGGAPAPSTAPKPTGPKTTKVEHPK